MSKIAHLGDYLLWNGKLAKIIGLIDHPAALIRIEEPNLCPHCNGHLEPDHITSILGSSQFKDSAEPIPTIAKRPDIEYDRPDIEPKVY